MSKAHQAIALKLSRAGRAEEKKVAERSLGGMIGDPNGVSLLGAPAGLQGLAGAMSPPGAMDAPGGLPSGAPGAMNGIQGLAAGGSAEGVAGPDKDLTLGPILSAVPGRTDAHATHVPSGSYVIPADIVSGRGQGNTIAGSEALKRLFKIGGLKRQSSVKNALKPPMPKMRADGGLVPMEEAPQEPAVNPVRVNLAGGEIVVPPENLLDTVHPDLKTAHEIMDAWVIQERKNLRKELGRLPPPVKE